MDGGSTIDEWSRNGGHRQHHSVRGAGTASVKACGVCAGTTAGFTRLAAVATPGDGVEQLDGSLS
jgi:hypothetical protein